MSVIDFHPCATFETRANSRQMVAFQRVETGSHGIEVGIGLVNKELGKLWNESEAGVTRASLINLVVVNEAADSLGPNSVLVGELTREHACRAIVIAADRSAEPAGAKAWINAHCHIRGGQKRVCCEQITFLLGGATADFLPNIVFSSLDSDLPLYFWWQGPFPSELNPEIVRWVDRLIFDSADWAQPKAGFDALKPVSTLIRRRETLCDLNWTRSSHLRLAVAHLFDYPTVIEERDSIRDVEIRHARGAATQARLVLGWLAARLGWKVTGAEPGCLFLINQLGRPAIARFQTDAALEEGIGLVSIRSAKVEVRVFREPESAFFHTAICVNGICSLSDLMPLGPVSLAEIVRAELASGGRHRSYPEAFSIVHPHWSGAQSQS